MAKEILIVGAGPAAAASALVWSSVADVSVTVLDIGGQLESDKIDARERLSQQPPEMWPAHDLAEITEQPKTHIKGSLPEKRSYGSDFPFRDFGQRAGLETGPDVHNAIVSGAYGGFSNVWGAQVMPFSRATFGSWPVSYEEMRPHYEAILREIPYSAEDDDLAELFPLMSHSDGLPALAERSTHVLNHYTRHRSRLQRLGVTVGRARLALNSTRCLHTGLCMTGCPYSLIYSASHTFDKLRNSGRIRYFGGLRATHIDESGDRVTVTARELSTDRDHRFSADRVLVGCGAVGSTRLCVSSLRLFDEPAVFDESVQFMLPFLSRRPTGDPRLEETFTLNQFNMVIDITGGGYDLSQLHFYAYNNAFIDALPRVLNYRLATPFQRASLKRLSVALGYLPSWVSPRFEMMAQKPRVDGDIADVVFREGTNPAAGSRFLRSVLRKTVAAAPLLDLWPVLPSLSVSSSGKSYHWGGSFKHSRTAISRHTSDMLGRVKPWTRVHLIDAAVFPSIPATTFTLSVMANSHRIASGILQELG